MVELADTLDSGSSAPQGRRGSTPLFGKQIIVYVQVLMQEIK